MKPASPVLWFSWDWDTPAFDASAIAACGCTGVIAVAVPIHFGPQNQRLTLDDVRAVAQRIKGRSGTLDVWLSFNTVAQVPVPRTLCRPKDQAARTQLLDNYATIGRVCKEFGFSLALNAEDMAGGPLSWPDEPGARDLGTDLARACRRDNAGLRLAAYGPVGTPPDGFRKVWRGFFEAAGKGAIYFNIDSYGLLQVDPKQALQHAQDVTHCAVPGLGWWPDGNAPDKPAHVAAAAAKVQQARKAGVPIMVYREGVMSDAARAALGKVLGGS